MDKVENDVYQIKNKLSEIDFHIQTSLPQNEGIFFDGQIFDAYKFASDLIKTAKISTLMNRLPMFKDGQTGDLSNAGWLADRVVNIPGSVI
ncbi:MAG TPA: hypothetical protein ENI76_07520 [Ignavibacteria bacterium]|nr:hypothetical protein [Ignavibacteria bacterium]